MVAGVGANLGELVGLRMLEQHQQAQNRALERLSTGKRINRGRDDPAGLIAATALGAQAAALNKHIKDLEIDSYRLSAKDGALSVIEDLATDLESAVIAAANTGANSKAEREAYQLDAEAIIDGIEFILQSSTFDGENIFKNASLKELGTAYRAAPAPPPAEEPAPEPTDPVERIRRALAAGTPTAGTPGTPAETSTTELTLDDIRNGALNLVDGHHEIAQQLVGAVRKNLTGQRASIGAQLKNFYDPQIRSLTLELEGTIDAQSKIQDADFAVEVSEYVRSQVLAQAATIVIQRSRENAANAALALLG